MVNYSTISNKNGGFTVLALDHRDSLISEFKTAGEPVGRQALIDFKRDMLTAIGSRPSAVMLEPEYSLPDLTRYVADGVGISCALEAQGYFGDPEAGGRLMDGWHPARVTQVGADAAKLLILFRHDQKDLTALQENLVTTVVEQAAQAEIPILIEPVPYNIKDSADRSEVIIQSAKRLSSLGPMLLKLPFPGSNHCEALTQAAGTNPWVLLSWGVDFQTFSNQLRQACAAGCSGFAAGRALWKEGLAVDERAAFCATTYLERFELLSSIVSSNTR